MAKAKSAPLWVQILASSLPQYEKATLIALLSFGNHLDGTSIRPAVASVAARASIGERTAHTCIRNLRALGILIRETVGPVGRGQTVRYRINVERLRDMQALGRERVRRVQASEAVQTIADDDERVPGVQAFAEPAEPKSLHHTTEKGAPGADNLIRDLTSTYVEGAEAPNVDPETRLFGDCLRSLIAHEKAIGGKRTDQTLRSIIGKWKRDHGTVEAIHAISAALREGAVDPVEFIQRRFHPAAKPSTSNITAAEREDRRARNAYMQRLVTEGRAADAEKIGRDDAAWADAKRVAA